MTVTPAPPAHVVAVPQRRGLRAIASGIHRTAVTIGARTPPTALLGPLGPRVGIGFAEADLAALARGAESRGVTVNDALLAAVAAGFDALLAALGETTTRRVRVSVPVALPRVAGSGNRVGVMLVELPLGAADPDGRVRVIGERTRAAKTDARSRGSLELVRSRLGMRLMRTIADRQRLVAGFVTNVPGPPAPLSLAGAPVSNAWPISGARRQRATRGRGALLRGPDRGDRPGRRRRAARRRVHRGPAGRVDAGQPTKTAVVMTTR